MKIGSCGFLYLFPEKKGFDNLQIYMIKDNLGKIYL